MTDKHDVRFAALIAGAAHRGQKDKLGKPYISHPRRVAESLDKRDYEGQCVAWLHDVLEDTSGAIRDYYGTLINMSFDKPILDALDALTHQEYEPRAEYYERIKAAGDLAVRVKLADIADNMLPWRLAELPFTTRMRLMEKYKKAREALSEGKN